MRTLIELPDEHIEPLETLAEQMHLSRAEVVRRAVAEYLQRNQSADGDAAFGLWQDRHEDGLAFQERMRLDWD